MRTLFLVVLLSGMAFGQTFDTKNGLTDQRPQVRLRALREIQDHPETSGVAVDDVLAIANDGMDSIHELAARAIIALSTRSDMPILDRIANGKGLLPATRDLAKKKIDSLGPWSAEEQRWLKDCSSYVVLDGKPMQIPAMDLTYRSSAKMNDKQVAIAAARARASGGAFLGNATDLPTVSVGEFGEIRYITVTQILSKDSLSISLGGAQIQLHGVSTENLVDDQEGPPPSTWPLQNDKGLLACIIGTTRFENTLGAARTIYLAIPEIEVWHGISFDQWQTTKPTTRPNGG